MIQAVSNLLNISRTPSNDVDEKLPTTEVLVDIGAGWDALVANFSDVCLEQTASYMESRWGGSRLCGLALRGVMSGEVEAAALVVVAAVPVLKAGLAYVKFGPMWRRRDEPVRPSVLTAALSAIRREFSELRGLVTRVMPPADPEHAPVWTRSLSEAGFHKRTEVQYPERYLVDLSLPENEQLKSLAAKWRANLRKVSPTVTVREADPRTELPAFLALYESMRDRKQFADHHRIENLTAFINKTSAALHPRLFLACAEGRPVAASMVVEAGDYAFVPYSATNSEALPLRAGYALRWEIMSRLRGSPARWLDLGGDEGDSGLRHFKAGNVGARGRIVTIPGEYECPGRPLSIAAAAALQWMHQLSRLKTELSARIISAG
jgi:hypothetical protein